MTYRHNWGERRRFYFHDAEGRLAAVPAAWTDVFSPDPFVVISAGRSASAPPICWNSPVSSPAFARKEAGDEHSFLAGGVSG